jgi:O-antigen/teichoic acid export membrane protein
LLIIIAFILNSLMNFAIGLLVAKFLGPAEYGRYALAFLGGSMLQWLLFEWIRAAALRFYSETTRLDRPEIRATLDALFLAVSAFVGLAALIVALSGVALPLSNDLVAAALAVSTANAAYDFASGLLRARFHDRGYAALVIVKNLLSILFVVGGAWWFGSARMALVGVVASVVGVIVMRFRELRDTAAPLSLRQWTLTGQFLRYAWPICLGSLVYQSIPMLDRALAARWHGLAEAGQFALAFDISMRLLNALGTSLDVLLFQMAVRADHEGGPEASRRQIADNMAIIAAVLLPACVGLLLVLPSFEQLFVPASFHSHFTRYFTILTPTVTIAALTSFAINPVFQIARNTMPLIFGGLVAALANILAIALLPQTSDAFDLAEAQFIGMVAGFLAVVGYAIWHGAQWPRARTLLLICLATGAMGAAVAPLRAMQPGALALLTQAGVGAAVYVGLAMAFDIAGLRGMLLPRVKRLLGRA